LWPASDNARFMRPVTVVRFPTPDLDKPYSSLTSHSRYHGRRKGQRGENGANNSPDANSLRGRAKRSNKYIIQCSTLFSEWSQVRIWGRQTCSLPRASSNLVAPLRRGVVGAPGFLNSTFFYYIFSKKGRFLSFGKEKWNSTTFESLGNIFMATSRNLQ